MSNKQFLKEWVQVFLLVALTYNPTGYCYLIWVSDNRDLPASIVLTFGFALAAAYVYVLKSAISGLGKGYMIALFVFLLLLFWTLVDLGVVTTPDAAFLSWLLLGYLSFTLTVGKVWPQLRKRRMLTSSKRKQKPRDDQSWLDDENW